MNRKGLKQASSQCIADSQSRPLATTLAYYIILYVIQSVNTVVVQKSGLDLTSLMETLYSAGLTDIFDLGIIGGSGTFRLTWVVNILCQLVTAVITTGFYLYCLRLSRKQAKGFADITEALSHTGKIIILAILISVFTFLWSMLFIIPGIIASYRYRMAYFALMDNPELSPMEALALSKRITKGHKFEIFMLDLSFLGWHILCLLTFGILYIWKMPYITTTYAHAFNWLMGLQTGFEPEPPSGPEIV